MFKPVKYKKLWVLNWGFLYCTPGVVFLWEPMGTKASLMNDYYEVSLHEGCLWLKAICSRLNSRRPHSHTILFTQSDCSRPSSPSGAVRNLIRNMTPCTRPDHLSCWLWRTIIISSMPGLWNNEIMICLNILPFCVLQKICFICINHAYWKCKKPGLKL